MSAVRAAWLVAALMAVARPAAGQSKPAPMLPEPAGHPEGEYGGVVPGRAERPAGAPRRRKPAKPTVTWVGFQPLEGATARVFVQLSHSATFEQQVVGNELVVTIADVALALGNHARPLDTAFFDTAVARIAAQRIKAKDRKGVEVHITFKGDAGAPANARLEQGQDDYHYLFLDIAPPGR